MSFRKRDCDGFTINFSRKRRVDSITRLNVKCRRHDRFGQAGRSGESGNFARARARYLTENRQETRLLRIKTAAVLQTDVRTYGSTYVRRK